MQKLPVGPDCFVCGRKNPIGLKLDFYLDGPGRCVSNFVIPENYQSYPEITHGGIVAAILDETSGKSINEDPNQLMVTMELTIRYHLPVPINRPLRAVGSLIRRRGKAAQAKGEIFDNDGRLLAESTGMFVDFPKDQQEILLQEAQDWRVYPDEP